MTSLESFSNDEAYYADKEYLSNSMLKLLRESPLKFKLFMEGKWSYPSASHFAVGTAVHSLFLEGVENVAVWDGTRRGKEYDQFKLQCEEQKVEILNQKEYSDVISMVQKLQKNEDVSALMGSFKAEVPMTRQLYGFKMKGKADAVVEHWQGDYIVDLKTTAKSIDDFYKSAKYMLYNQQAALYCELFGTNTFYFVVIEKSWPFEIGIFKCSEEFISQGKRELEKSLSLYDELFIQGKFKENSARLYEL